MRLPSGDGGYVGKMNASDARAIQQARDQIKMDSQAETARITAREQLAAAEDSSREYSELVQHVKARYDRLAMSEGFCLNVYASRNSNNGIADYMLPLERRDEDRLGVLLASLNLAKPFSLQWPKDLDSLTVEAAQDMAPEGMYAKGSAFMTHTTLLEINKRTPQEQPLSQADAARVMSGRTDKMKFRFDNGPG